MKNIRALFLLFALSPLLTFGQTGRVIVTPDQLYEPTLNKTASISFDTLTNELILNPKLIASVRIPNTLTLPAFVRAALSVSAGPLTFNSTTGTFGFTPLAVADVTGLVTSLSGKEPTVTGGTVSQYFRGDKTFVTLDKTAVGLGSVDNTADVSKPVSSAQLTALNAKENTITAGTTAQVILGNKTLGTLAPALVNLANVDNTSDAAKPVSTAGQTALNLKANLASPSLTGAPTAPTVLTSDNSVAIATTAWVRAQSYGVAGASPNTASNVGTAGVGIFKTINVSDIQFKKANVGSNKVTITDDVANNEVDFDIVEANITLPQSNVTGLSAALTGKEPTITAGTASQFITGTKGIGTFSPATVGLGSVANSLQVINGGGVVSMLAGLFSARPTFGTSGRIYYATDSRIRYYDTGAAWDVMIPAYSGDFTTAAGGTAGTLATVNTNVGAFGSGAVVPTVTVNGKGLVTAVTTTAISPAGIGAEPAITAGTTAQVLLGNKTLGTLNPTLVGLANVPNVDATNATNSSSGTLPALRLPAFSGAIATVAGSSVAALSANIVTNTNMALVPANTLKGNNSGASVNPVDLTTAQVKTMLAVDQVSNTTDAAKPVSTAQLTALNLKPENVSIAALRASSGATYGAATITDLNRGGGTYVYDAGSVEADNGGTILKTFDNRVYKLQRQGKLDVQVFGVGYGVGVSAGIRTANATALNAAANAGVPILISGWVEMAGTITVTGKALSIEGTGRRAGISQFSDANLLVFTTDITDKFPCVIANLTLYPGVAMTTTKTAIRIISGGGNESSVDLTNIKIGEPVNTTNYFPIGVHVSNPAETMLESVRYYGPGKDAGVGFKFDGTGVSISSTLRNCKVYGANVGLDIVSSTSPGIEGVRVLGCDFVVCDIGIRGESTHTATSYLPPQFDVIDSHFNCFTAGIRLIKYAQISLKNNLIYLYNTPSSATGIELTTVNDVMVEGNKIFNVGGGPSYGITTNGTSDRIRIRANTGQLRSANTEAFVIINTGTVNADAENNRSLFGQYSVFDATGLAETRNNYLSGVLESDIPRVEPQTAQQGNTTNVTYYKLGDFAAFNGGGNIDMARIAMHVGTWNANSRQDIDVSLSTRDNFSYLYSRKGQQQTTSGLLAYRNADNTTTLYAVLGGAFQRITVTPLQAWGLVGWPRKLSTIGTVTAPTGTIIFDTRNPATYPPVEDGYVARSNHTGTQTLSTLSQSGATTGQVAQWNGTAWVAAASSGGSTTDASLLTTGTLSTLRLPAATGDVTRPAGSDVNTLATVNPNVGAFGSATVVPVITVNGKGLTTGVTTAAISIPFTQVTGAATSAQTPLAVQGSTALTRALYIANPNVDLPSGFYTTSSSANMPTTGTWYIINNHHENTTVNSGVYMWQLAYQVAGTALYTRLVDAGTYGSWVIIGGGGGGTTTDASLLTSGTLSALRLPAETGAVTRPAGSDVNTIAAGVITNANMVGMVTKTYRGRTAAGTGVPEDVPVATLKSDLALNLVPNVDATNGTNITTGTVAVARLPAGVASGVATLDASTRLPIAQLPTPGTVAVTATTYTFVATDCYKTLLCSNAATQTITIPASLLLAGCPVNVVREGAGTVTFAAGAGLTLNSAGGFLSITTQWGMATVVFRSTTTAVLGGNIN